MLMRVFGGVKFKRMTGEAQNWAAAPPFPDRCACFETPGCSFILPPMPDDALPVRESKLRRPPLAPAQIRRPRLVERILRDFQSGRQTLLISAPAGYGKTSLAVDLAASLAPMPVAWLSLDPADDDPARFFSHLAASVERSGAGSCARVRGILRSGRIPSVETAAAALSDDIWDIDAAFLLVLDDFHSLSGAHAGRTLQALASVPPRSLRLAVATRRDPDLPLDGLRARNRLAEIRPADLSFRVEDVRGYLRDCMGLELDPGEAGLLLEKTEGWAAGIQLAGLAMSRAAQAAGAPDPEAVPRFIASLSGGHRYILRYLTEEVVNAHPERVRRFLFKTSILGELCAGLCDAVTGTKDSGSMIDRLLQANLFLLPVDEEGRWFRYHTLFAEALRELAGARVELRASHRAASAWFESNGRPDMAIEHAWAGGEEERAVRIIEAESIPLIARGYTFTVEAWLARIPAARLSQSPRALLVWAWIHSQYGSLDRMKAYLEMLSPAFASEADPPLTAEWLALKSKAALSEGRFPEARDYADKSARLARGCQYIPAALIRMTLAETYRGLGDDARTRESYQEVIDGGRAAGDAAAELLGVSGLVQTAIFRGRLTEAETLSRRGLDLIDRHALVTPISSACHGTLAQVHFLRFQIEDAHRHFMPMLSASGPDGFQDADIYYSAFRSRLLLCEGDVQAADREISKAVEALQSAKIRWFDDDVMAQWTCVRLAQGRRAEAEAALADRGFGKNGSLEVPRAGAGRGFYPRTLHTSVLNVLIRRAEDTGDAGLLQECARSAGELAEASLSMPNLRLAIEFSLLRGKAHALAGNPQVRLDDYRRALELAEPEGYVFPFVQEGRDAADALRELLKRDGAGSGFIDRILAAFPAAAGAQTEPARKPDELIEALTRREREVLSFMARGLTYEQTSEALFVSLNTIRSHVKSIYAKLGSENRTQALERAKSLGVF